MREGRETVGGLCGYVGGGGRDKWFMREGVEGVGGL